MRKLFLISFICLATTAISFAQLKVLTNGNVGIKNTNPSRPFHVTGSAVFTSGTTISSFSPYIRGKNGTTTASSPEYSWVNDSTTGIFHPATNILGFTIGGSEKLRVESDGDVCIGVTSSSNQGKVYIQQTNYNATSLRVFKNATGTFGYNFVSQVLDTATKSIVSQISGVDKFCVFGNGKTQIGAVFSPTPHMLTVWGTTYSYQGYYSSDIQYKQNITPVATAIDKLNQLNGVRYSYNSAAFPQMNFPSGFTYGVIAQEVQAILPELVQTDSTGYLAVNYDGLIPILIEAIKEQQVTIKNQEYRLNTVETDLVNCCNIKPSSTEKSTIISGGNGENNSIEKQNGSSNPSLYQNIPNPFKEKTTIRYYLPNESTMASLLVFDMNGKLIKTYPINSTGNGNIEINGGELQPGMYMYSLIANGKEVDTKKMILTE
ncbi:MAG: tail fiber domain-containing protein [Bacteroidia bacterium]|nr:tail fiber domain-containing protein [Bacteroidia bacterium]